MAERTRRRARAWLPQMAMGLLLATAPLWYFLFRLLPRRRIPGLTTEDSDAVSGGSRPEPTSPSSSPASEIPTESWPE